MCIKMKAKNNQYTFIMDDKVPYVSLINKLESLLDQSIFKNIAIYPQAFFDFQRRRVNGEELTILLDLLLEKQVLLFGGIVIEEKRIREDVQIVEKTIHGGEIEIFDRPTLLIGNLNPGSVIEIKKDFYVLGKIAGTVKSYHKNTIIYCQSMENANIRISDASLQNVTSFAPMKVYYQDKEILCQKGDMSDVKNNCSNVG